MSSASQALEGLYKAPSAEECYVAAEQLAEYVNSTSLRVLQSEGVLDSLVKASKNKRRAATSARLPPSASTPSSSRSPARTLPAARSAQSHGSSTPSPPSSSSTQTRVTSSARLQRLPPRSLSSTPPPEAAPNSSPSSYEVLGSSGSAEASACALKLIGPSAQCQPLQRADRRRTRRAHPLPHQGHARDKAEISKQARKTAIKVCEACLDNKDIRPFIPDLVGCMAQPDAVPECIKKLSGTTFVAEVTGPARSPSWCLCSPVRSTSVARRTASGRRRRRQPLQARARPARGRQVPPRTHSRCRANREGRQFPEVREHAKSALDTLTAATAAVDASAATEDPKKVFAQQCAAALDAILAAVQAYVPEEHANLKSDAFAMTGLNYLSKSVARLANKRILHTSAWEEVYVLPYLRRVCKDDDAAKTATADLRKTYIELDKARFGNSEEEDDDEAGECLCRTEFSLAYGGLLLLNHTTLKLYRGHRYGIVAANGSGKSPLLKAMRDGKVEGYPSQDEVRTLMVEHSLQGEDGSTPIIDFIANDKKLVGKTREQVAEKLRESVRLR